MINKQYERAKEMLSKYKKEHNELAQLLIDKEVIFAEDVERILGKRPWASRSEEIMESEKNRKAKLEDGQKHNSEDKEDDKPEAEKEVKDKKDINTDIATGQAEKENI